VSNTVTALQRLVHDHPAIALDLNDALAAMEGEDRLARHEVEAIQDRAHEAWLSFRAEAPSEADQAAQRVHNASETSDVPASMQRPLTDRGSADMRADVRRRHTKAKALGPGYDLAMAQLARRDRAASQAVRRYVSALRAEAAAARVYTKALMEGRLS